MKSSRTECSQGVTCSCCLTMLSFSNSACHLSHKPSIYPAEPCIDRALCISLI